MDRTTAVVLTAVAGGLIALQAPINSHLGRRSGPSRRRWSRSSIGTVALVVAAALAKGGLGQVADARGLPWYWFLGGAARRVYVCAVLVTVADLGRGGVDRGHDRGPADDVRRRRPLRPARGREGPVTAAQLAGIALLAVGVAARRRATER